MDYPPGVYINIAIRPNNTFVFEYDFHKFVLIQHKHFAVLNIANNNFYRHIECIHTGVLAEERQQDLRVHQWPQPAI